MNNRDSEDLFHDALFAPSVFKEGGEQTLHLFYIPQTLQFQEANIRWITQKFHQLFLSDDRGLAGFSTNIALTGPVGVGKTVTARYTLNHLQSLADREHIRLYTDYKMCIR